MPDKRGAGGKKNEKINAHKDCCCAGHAAFPIAAIAAQPAKTMTERGVIEKVSAPRMQFAHNWLGSRCET